MMTHSRYGVNLDTAGFLLWAVVQWDMTPEFSPVGDRAARIVFGVDISPPINAHIRRFCHSLEVKPIWGVTEWVPGYAAVTVYYRPWDIAYDALCGELARRGQRRANAPRPEARRVEIPVCYGGDYGPDLGEVAAAHGLTPAQVIERHSGVDYLVYFLGFLPGFPYLGGLDPSLATPRRATPRRSVPAGSVGIAGAQTGVYPLETPGGWQIIGRTPICLYDPHRQPPTLLAAGAYVRFISITARQFEEIVNDSR